MRACAQQEYSNIRNISKTRLGSVAKKKYCVFGFNYLESAAGSRWMLKTVVPKKMNM